MNQDFLGADYSYLEGSLVVQHTALFIVGLSNNRLVSQIVTNELSEQI